MVHSKKVTFKKSHYFRSCRRRHRQHKWNGQMISKLAGNLLSTDRRLVLQQVAFTQTNRHALPCWCNKQLAVLRRVERLISEHTHISLCTHTGHVEHQWLDLNDVQPWLITSVSSAICHRHWPLDADGLLMGHIYNMIFHDIVSATKVCISAHVFAELREKTLNIVILIQP